MIWLASLLAGSEHQVDSLVFGCLLAVLAVLLVSTFLAVLDHATWNPLTLSTGIATILGAAHGAKAYRDKQTGDDK